MGLGYGGYKEYGSEGERNVEREFYGKNEDNKFVLGKWVGKMRMRKQWSRIKKQDIILGRKELIIYFLCIKRFKDKLGIWLGLKSEGSQVINI